LKKEKRDANAKPSRIIKQTKEKKYYLIKRKQFIKLFKRKKHSHTAANQSNDNSKYYIKIELFSKNDNKEEPKLNKIEKIIFIKEEINKSISAD